MQTFKSAFTWVALVLSLYILAPTLLQLGAIKEKFKSENKPLPWYYQALPDTEINLGLDLRGGLSIEMEVDLEEALDHQVNVLLSDVRHLVFRDELEKLSAERVGPNLIRVEVPTDQIATLRSSVTKIFGPDPFAWQSGENEVFYQIQGDSEAARKQVTTALAALGTETTAAPEAIFTHDQRHLGIAFTTEAQKQKITAALAASDVASVVQPIAYNNVIYMEATPQKIEQIKKDIIEQAATSVRNRIDRYGVSEAAVSRQGDERLVVELPGAKNPDELISLIKTTGKLEFRLVDNKLTGSKLKTLLDTKMKELNIDKPYEDEARKKLNLALKADLPENTEILFSLDRDAATKKVTRYTPYVVSKTADVTGDMLESAGVESQNGLPHVAMSFGKIGTQKFGEVTSKNIHRQLAIVLDNTISSAPEIQSSITGGKATISLGRGNPETLFKEAQDLSLILKEGALPASLKVASKNIVGPSLGQDSIDAGVRSILISGAAVVLFMLLYYRLGGLVANLALVLNIILMFALLALFGASLTLPGMAGVVLTMGMAVDANVIIFERMREEKFKHSNISTIVNSSYDSAMSAILDGNITTFIAGIFMFEFGSGPIKGFATTLMIGILTTLFTAVVVTRLMYNFAINKLQMKSVGF